MISSRHRFRLVPAGPILLEPCAAASDSVPPPRVSFVDPWHDLAYALHRAKRGDFGAVAPLLDLWGRTGDREVDSMCTWLVAMAGPANVFGDVVTRTLRAADSYAALGFCGALAQRGELAYVPILLEVMRRRDLHSDVVEMLKDYIGWLIGDQPHATKEELGFEAWVEAQSASLGRRFGTQRVLVARGERYSVAGLARRILDDVRQHPAFFLVQHRIDFECATGIPCGHWYRDGALQESAVVDTTVRFLTSGDSTRYEDGKRYFFGHAVDR